MTNWQNFSLARKRRIRKKWDARSRHEAELHVKRMKGWHNKAKRQRIVVKIQCNSTYGKMLNPWPSASSLATS